MSSRPVATHSSSRTPSRQVPGRSGKPRVSPWPGPGCALCRGRVPVLNVRPGIPAGQGRHTRQEADMRRPAPVRAAGGVLAVSPAAALAATPPLTGSLAVEDQLPVQPGHPASCSFPVAVHRQVRGTYQLLLDTQGQPARLLLHEHWTGTGAANGTYVAGHAAQKRHRGISSPAPRLPPARSTTRSRSAASSSTTAGCSASTPAGTSPSRPARTRDSTVTPSQFRSSALHCPDPQAGQPDKARNGIPEFSQHINSGNPERNKGTVRIPRLRTIIGLISGPALIASALATFTLASAGPAAAGQPVTQALTPPPPSFYTCKTAGNGVICEGALSESYGPDDTGIACGSGAGAFDIFDQGTHNKHAIRFYNAA